MDLYGVGDGQFEEIVNDEEGYYGEFSNYCFDYHTLFYTLNLTYNTIS